MANNHPELYDKFIVPRHLAKVTLERDTKLSNTASIEIQREDHTIGEPLVTHLHDDKNVIFAAMKIPHPLEHRVIIRVRTNGAQQPQEAYNQACLRLQSQLARLKEAFKSQIEAFAQSDPSLQVDWEPDAAYEQQVQMQYAEQDAFGVQYDPEYGGGGLADPSLAFD